MKLPSFVVFLGLFYHTIHKASTATSTKKSGCILLIGDSDHKADVEYYHPEIGVECDRAQINVSSVGINYTAITSGCYLNDSGQILIRETMFKKPPMLYNLRDGSVKRLPPPQIGCVDVYTSASTSAFVAGMCMSCGGEWTPDRGQTLEPISNCYQYGGDGQTSSLVEMPGLPRAVTGAASVAVGGDYYVIANGRAGWTALFRYTNTNKQWQRQQSLRHQRIVGTVAAAALSSRSFIFCGATWAHLTRRDCHIYDTGNNTWRAAAPLTAIRDFYAMVHFDGCVYALGGQGMQTVVVYDVGGDRWLAAKQMNEKRGGFVAVVIPPV